MALAQMIKRGVVASVNNKKEQIKDSIKESVMNVPLIGSMIKIIKTKKGRPTSTSPVYSRLLNCFFIY